MKKIIGTFLALALLSAAVFAAPVAVGNTETANEAVSIPEAAFEIEAAAVLEAEEDYGELIVDIDFEDREAGTTGFTALLDSEFPGSTFAGMPSFTPAGGNGFTPANASFKEENGNTYMSYTATKDYIQMYLNTSSALPSGTYTISLDMRPKNINGATGLGMNFNGTYNSFDHISDRDNVSFTKSSDEFMTKVYRGKMKSGVSLSKIEFLIFGSNTGVVMDFDNIKIWYEDGKYAVNFDNGGMGTACTSIASSTRVTKGSSINLSDYRAASNGFEFLG